MAEEEHDPADTGMGEERGTSVEAHAEDAEEGVQWRADVKEGTWWRINVEEEWALAGVWK
jgi:hypothetical protein